jgi:hypothetical protein
MKRGVSLLGGVTILRLCRLGRGGAEAGEE